MRLLSVMARKRRVRLSTEEDECEVEHIEVSFYTNEKEQIFD